MRPDGVAGPIARKYRRSSGPLPADVSVKTGVAGGGAWAVKVRVARPHAAARSASRLVIIVGSSRCSEYMTGDEESSLSSNVTAVVDPNGGRLRRERIHHRMEASAMKPYLRLAVVGLLL